MNKSELVALVAAKTGTSKLKTAEVVEAVIESITDAVANNEPVVLLGFGTFTLRDRAARTGHNPRTGEPIHIAASQLPSFKAGKNLKERCQ